MPGAATRLPREDMLAAGKLPPPAFRISLFRGPLHCSVLQSGGRRGRRALLARAFDLRPSARRDASSAETGVDAEGVTMAAALLATPRPVREATSSTTANMSCAASIAGAAALAESIAPARSPGGK